MQDVDETRCEPALTGSWIWTSEEVPVRNSYVRFRRCFRYEGGAARIRITADSRYVLYVNGEYVGQGPVRAWPNHWRTDSYDISPHLVRGENVVAVVVNHFGEGTFQYLHCEPGLLAEIRLDEHLVASDDSWFAAPDPAFVSGAPRISCQESFEEQFDAGLDDGWRQPGYDDSSWPRAVALRPAADGLHNNLADRGIPFLTQEPVLPKRLISAEVVRSLPYRFTAYLKPYIVPGDLSSNMLVCHAYLVTRVWSPADADIRITSPHKNPAGVRINGRDLQGGKGALASGWNVLVAAIHGGHIPEYVLCIDGPDGLRLSAAEDSDSEWALVGPFGLTPEMQSQADHHMDESRLAAAAVNESAGWESGLAFWDDSDLARAREAGWTQIIRPEHLPAADAFAQAYTDTVASSDLRVENEDALLSGAGWVTVHPPVSGDARLLVDFGDEFLAFHRFELDAPAGTILDVHNFEFVQPSGRLNLAEGMNNSFRYICREGRQSYQTWQHRGFRYSFVMLRNMTGPVRIRGLQAVFNSYPQARRGTFACSDAKLDLIWQAGAQSLRCCSEDTYTDCPTYEQVNWVGDARNEALIDWVINGDPRLWFRCLEQTGQSLERSPITESHVPSAWRNLLPAWSFLWMRSCREYVLYTGRAEDGARLLPFIERNVKGVSGFLDDQGLFSIRAWNLFDWAPMDTPPIGVVTHQNCFAVLALREAAEMAEWLDRPGLGRQWRELAEGISDAVNNHLWNGDRQAYTDCLHGSEHSKVFSQQTQAAAFVSGVASGDRALRCRETMSNPPEGFVRAGSPFFEFFLLEALRKEGGDQEILSAIRSDWGFMIDAGATTFWEMWSSKELGFGSEDRLTRSHCHGWSAAPTYFLSEHVLGVRPGGLGYSPIVVEPHPGDLEWCRGVVPTPHGDVNVQWENAPGSSFDLRVVAPKGAVVSIRLPRDAKATLNGAPVGPSEIGSSITAK